MTVTYPMSLRAETVCGNDKRGALMYGPVVLAGDMGTKGMKSPAPFSDPTVRNDYYTYDYNIPEDLPTTLRVDLSDITKSVRKLDGLNFETEDGIKIAPLYDTHRTRYVVYWDLE